MTISSQVFVLGALRNNSFVIFDEESKRACVIDPTTSDSILNFLHEKSLILEHVLITHAHFDHIGGVEGIRKAYISNPPKVAMHATDKDLWLQGAGAGSLGYKFFAGELPDMDIEHKQKIQCGNYLLEVRHTPGHTPGHVVYYSQDLSAVFCGDLIFQNGIGRTDFIGGDEEILYKSIREQIFTLPDATILFPGHGQSTSIAREKVNNPYLLI